MSKVYLKLTTGKQENLRLINGKLTDQNNSDDDNNFKAEFSSPRWQLMQLSNDEKKQHEKFINNMTNSLWKKIE